MSVSEIVEFLEARLADDERWANAEIEGEVQSLRRDGMPDVTREDVVDIDDTDYWRRPLREVAAKRAVIGKYLWADRVREQMEEDDDDVKWEWIFKSEALVEVLFALASVYSDHPDFNPDWAE